MKKFFGLSLFIVLAVAFVVYYFIRIPEINLPANLIDKQPASLIVEEKLNPVFSFTDFPETVSPGSEIDLKWRVDVGFVKPFLSAALHYGTQPQAGQITLDSYTNTVENYQGVLPQDFTDKIKAPSSGKLYLRGHVTLDNVNYFSEEKVILIKK